MAFESNRDMAGERRSRGVRGALVCLWLTALTVSAAPLPDARRAQLRDLVLEDCGSCHGLRLTGGLGPPLTREALSGRTLAAVAATIRDGRAGTPMPPWKPLLSDADIDWIAHFLKDGGGAP